MWIIVDGGDTFEGTLEQFKDCFFDNATKETILDWAASTGSKVDFRDKPPLSLRQIDVSSIKDLAQFAAVDYDREFLCVKGDAIWVATINKIKNPVGVAANADGDWVYVDCPRRRICYGIRELDELYLINKE